MSAVSKDVRGAQVAYVTAYVRQIDPSATDASIVRYLAEIETMATTLQSVDSPDTAAVEPFTADWPGGESS